MTENRDELIEMTDAEIAFDVKMGLAIGGWRGKMLKPARGDDHWEVQAARVVDYFRRSRVRVFRQPDPPTLPSDRHPGSGPGSVPKPSKTL